MWRENESNQKKLFTFFIAKNEKFSMDKMFDPEDVIFKTEVEFTKKEIIVGNIFENYFYFDNLFFGDSNVSSKRKENFFKVLEIQNTSKLYFENVLRDAKIKVVKNEQEYNDYNLNSKNEILKFITF